MDVPIGMIGITELLPTSPILGGLGEGVGVGNFTEYGGINPDLDPDLAMAMKLSMEESKAE